MTAKDIVTIDLSRREVQLLLKYGYPFDNEKTQLEAFQRREEPGQLSVGHYYLSMMIADLVRSAKSIRSAVILDEIDALCCLLEAAEQGQPRIRAVK